MTGSSSEQNRPDEFLSGTQEIPGLERLTIGDFWRWALSNRNRSIFAEFIVGVALGVVDEPRIEWDAADFRYQGFKIEVKSSAYCQSWHHGKPSKITFSIRKAIVWNPATGKYEGSPTRCADVYVFCHYSERDRAKANVLDIPAWDFYVVSTKRLNQEFGESKSISLAAVRRVGVRCKFEGLKVTVDRKISAYE